MAVLGEPVKEPVKDSVKERLCRRCGRPGEFSSRGKGYWPCDQCCDLMDSMPRITNDNTLKRKRARHRALEQLAARHQDEFTMLHVLARQDVEVEWSIMSLREIEAAWTSLMGPDSDLVGPRFEP